MSHRKNLIVGLGVVLLTVLGSVSVAEAQGYPPPYYPPPPPPPAQPRGVYRAGVIYGFSAGLGAIGQSSYGGVGCGSQCGAAGLLEGHLGGMIAPRAALMFEVWGADHPWSDGAGNSHETFNTFVTGAGQFWLSDIFWLKGGLGLAYYHDTINGYGYYGNYSAVVSSASGFGIFGAGGIEVLQSYNFALDIQGRIGSGFYSQYGNSFSVQNYAVMVGFNWY
jgi:hypothetical protein